MVQTLNNAAILFALILLFARWRVLCARFRMSENVAKVSEDDEGLCCLKLLKLAFTFCLNLIAYTVRGFLRTHCIFSLVLSVAKLVLKMIRE